MQHERADVGRVLGERVDHRVAERFALRRPSVAAQVIGRVLHEARHHVLARRRHARVDHDGDDDVHVRPAREGAVLRVVVGALEVIDARRDRDGAARCGPAPGRQLKSGRPSSARFTLADGAAEPEAAHRRRRTRPGSCVRPTSRSKVTRGSAPRRRRSPRSPRRSRARRRCARPSARPDLRDAAPRRGSRRPSRAPRAAMASRHRAGAAARQAPRAEGAVDLAHVVVQQHVGRARRARRRGRCR